MLETRFTTRTALAAALLLAAIAGFSSAQRPGSGAPPNPDGDRSAALADLDRLAARGRKADRAKSDKADREFVERLAEFANAWNGLMQVREKGAWNPKQARQAHQAFERLVRSEGWVENAKE